MRGSLAALAALAIGALSPAAAQTEPGAPPARTARPTLVRPAASFSISPPVSELAKLQPAFVGAPRSRWERENRRAGKTVRAAPGAARDGAIQSETSALASMPSPTVSFDGLSSDNNLSVGQGRPIPPDPNGDVGPNHYVQMVNVLVGIYDKAGTLLVPFFPLHQLWDTIGPPCGGTDDGDPIVVYDPLADRWILSQLCAENTLGRNHELVAISTTGDPTGSYFVYDFLLPNSKEIDYPHFGVWPDAYYMTENQFIGDTFVGVGAFAFDRAKLVAGDPTASFVYFDEDLFNSEISGQLPTDLDGNVPPPVGTPNLFIDFRSTIFGDPADALRFVAFHVDWTNPESSTLTALPDVPIAAFDPRDTGSRDVVVQKPQPPDSTEPGLDAIAGQMMHRIAYRTLAGGVQSYVLNFVVNVSGEDPTGDRDKYQGGIRWVELRRNAGTGAITVQNDGTYAPGAGDGLNGRDVWLGSIAQDNRGDTALGFSASSLTLYPSILYAGRLASDPADTLSQGEATLMAGTGSQRDPSERWGDYSALSVDPSDDCTFWYTNEYYTAASSDKSDSAWLTKIGAFKFSSCTPAPAATIHGTVTDCGSGSPLSAVAVSSAEGFLRMTASPGSYSMAVAPGTYSMTASRSGYQSKTQMVTVGAGGSATLDFCLDAVPVPVASGSALEAEECVPPNRAIDPGETVTVNLCVTNSGAADTAALVGTLLATGGVNAPSGPQSFGRVAAGGGAVCRAFGFLASGSCGGTLVATLHLQDGSDDLGTVAFPFTVGAPVVSLSESFDAVTAPALPAGWTAANETGSGALWKTTTTNADSIPNAAFVDDPGSASDKDLTSPAIAIVSANAQVSFLSRFDFDEGFDGGVLEISSPNINAGAFTDVTDAAVGGSFVMGGYTETLQSGSGNPIVPGGGRDAWTGGSFGVITTVANLGPQVAGQTIRLRWRVGTNSSVSGTGWWIDDVQVTDGFACCATPTFVGKLLSVDDHSAAGTASDVDGVLEPGERVVVSPFWKNTDGSASVTGTASAFTGPSGATYTIPDTSASYGTIGSGATRDCFSATADCFQLQVSAPASRPSTHWDTTFHETLSGGGGRTWTLHLGGSFTDVPRSQPFYKKIETLFHNGITSGCGTATYCPGDAVSRSQMAIFIAKGVAHGAANVPPGGAIGGSQYYCGSGGVSLFSDVSVTDTFCRHVHYIAAQNITAGCAPSQYCPNATISRDEMAAFIAKATVAPGGGSSVPLTYGPDPVTGLSYSCNAGSPNVHFNDVPVSDPFCKSVHYLWARGIVQGCSPTQYCPNQSVTRDQMSKFLSNAFGLLLYGP